MLPFKFWNSQEKLLSISGQTVMVHDVKVHTNHMHVHKFLIMWYNNNN